MSGSNFHSVPKVPDSVAHLDPDVVVEVLSRHGVNVSDAAGEMGVASADLRRLLWANPKLTDAAVEIEERRLDLAERNIYEALKSDDPRRRDAASMFTIRNSHRARKRGWITTSASVAELSISTGANGPREFRFRWRCDDDDKRDAEAAEIERLEAEGKIVVTMGWVAPDADDDKPKDGPLIEHEQRSRPIDISDTGELKRKGDRQ
jgi:hypothetical protein